MDQLVSYWTFNIYTDSAMFTQGHNFLGMTDFYSTPLLGPTAPLLHRSAG